MFRPSIKPLSLGLAAVACLLAAELGMPAAHAAITIDWVTVGNPGNTADTTGYGAVADAFRIMKFEFTNSQYIEFLNSVDPNGTNPNSVYNSNMGVTNPRRGGISFIPSNASGSKYAAMTNMGDKPVNWVSWWDAARVSNWLMNGATGTSSMETGAYTLNNATSGTAPAVNSGATYYIPTEDQWYKAAYYKGGSTNEYWDYPTQSDTAPAPVTADSTGNGSAGSTGNFSNYDRVADWNGPFNYPQVTGNVTTVGTNGRPSAYDAFDMSGNVWEWNDLTGAAGSNRGYRGGAWGGGVGQLPSSFRLTDGPSSEYFSVGFRLAAVPEPSTYAMALAGLACGAWQMVRRRRAR